MANIPGKYSEQYQILQDTYKELDSRWYQIDWSLKNQLDTQLKDTVNDVAVIISKYQQHTSDALIWVTKRCAISGEQYYDPADILESIRPTFHTTPCIYQQLCNLIERNIIMINAGSIININTSTSTSTRCPKVLVTTNNCELLEVPIISDNNYLLIYQIIAQYSHTWL